MNKEYKELTEQGEELRLKLDEVLSNLTPNSYVKKNIWFKINTLIEIELNLESFCNE